MSANDRVLLTLCLPWVVAIPISAVVRVLTIADLTVRPTNTSAALLGTVDDGNAWWAAYDLAHLLGSRADDHQAWVLLNLSTPVALRTGPCLSVIAAPPVCAVPAILTARPLGLGCFARPTLPLPEALQTALAPVGLRLDPTRLFSAAELASAHQAVLAASTSTRQPVASR